MKSRTRVIAMLTLFTTCLLIAIFYGFSVIGRSPQSHLLMVVLAIAVPVAVGKIADRLWQKSA